jgi:hypothetical protein
MRKKHWIIHASNGSLKGDSVRRRSVYTSSRPVAILVTGVLYSGVVNSTAKSIGKKAGLGTVSSRFEVISSEHNGSG